MPDPRTDTESTKIQIEDIQIVRYNPKEGDILIISIPKSYSHDMLQRLQQHLQSIIPEGAKIIGVRDDIEIAVLRQDQIEASL